MYAIIFSLNDPNNLLIVNCKIIDSVIKNTHIEYTIEPLKAISSFNPNFFIKKYFQTNKKAELILNVTKTADNFFDKNKFNLVVIDEFISEDLDLIINKFNDMNLKFINKQLNYINEISSFLTTKQKRELKRNIKKILDNIL